MPSIFHQAIAVVSMIAVVMLVWWTQGGDSIGVVHSPPQLPEENPDAYAKGVQVLSYGVDGRVKHRIDADTVLHFSQLGLIRFEQPQLQLIDERGGHWSVVAERGHTLGEPPVLRFSDNVTVRRVQGAESGNADATKLLINTESIEYKTDEQVIRGVLPVTIEHGYGVTTASAMTVTVNDKKIQLEGDVKSHYATNE